MADFHWIDVKDRLPTKTGFYLVTIFGVIKNRVEIDFFFFDYEVGYWDNAERAEVLAWAEIPEPYKRQD